MNRQKKRSYEQTTPAIIRGNTELLLRQCGRKNHYHQLLSMVYALNSSFGKIIQVGLENLGPGSKEFIPVIRFCGPRFRGIPLTLECWEALKEEFDTIEDYFATPEESSMMDDRISIPGYTIHFTISYYESCLLYTSPSPRD